MVIMLASFYACGTEPISQALVISWCSLLNRLSPPCFHTSAGIPPPPGALPSFRPAIALAISSIVGNLIEACLGNALRDVVQSFVIYVARDIE